MANAINLIFEGAISKSLPAGMTQDQVVAAANAAGQTQFAEMASSMHLTPGVGIDFGQLALILGALAGVYIISAIFAWGQSYIMAGVTQRSVLRLRTEVDEKLGRLPLRYFDSHPRGDLLSRVTNDIDNIGQSLQQSPDPDHHVAAHDRRRADHDAADQPVPRPHLAARRAGLDWRDRPHRPALAAPVRRPVGLDRRAERPRRGDAHRPRDRQGVRPPARGDRAVRGGERPALRGVPQGPVHLRARSSRS